MKVWIALVSLSHWFLPSDIFIEYSLFIFHVPQYMYCSRDAGSDFGAREFCCYFTLILSHKKLFLCWIFKTCESEQLIPSCPLSCFCPASILSLWQLFSIFFLKLIPWIYWSLFKSHHPHSVAFVVRLYTQRITSVFPSESWEGSSL